VGDPTEVEHILIKYPEARSLPIEVVASQGVIREGEHPALALRQNPKASVAMAVRLVKEGRADAAVSVGSTGATMASAALILGLMNGLDRPALGGNFLGLAPHTVVMDLGSNVDVKPIQLVDYAVLGTVFAKKYIGVANPRVALLSVGTEEGKGNKLVVESYPLLQRSGLNFVGNVEGMDLLTGKADVIVCDGFVGNILLKFAGALGAGMASFIKKRLADRLSDSELTQLASQVWELCNAAKKMGGPLFGVNGAVIVGHGASEAEGVAGAVDTARRMVLSNLLESMRQELAAMRSRMAV
jgi:glycerol-3-phosphate acyltransferase PlsX